MDERNINELLKAKEQLKDREIKFINLQPYRPSMHEQRNLLLFVKLMGYHMKWNFKRQTPMIYSAKHKSHGYVQKENDEFYLIKGDRKYPIDLISPENIKTFEEYVDKHKKGLAIKALKRMWGIPALNYA